MAATVLYDSESVNNFYRLIELMSDRAPDDEPLLIDRQFGVLTLTLNRPARINAIDRRMLAALDAALETADHDPEVRAVVITGAGGAFSSGFDLKEQAALRPEGEEQWRAILERAFATIMRCWHLSKPTIAAVRGPCLAGGCELALACDLTIAGDDARFGEPELKFGAGIVVMLLPWLIGAKRAKDILLTGADDISAADALAMGMVSRVVPADAVLATARTIARRIALVDPALIGATKRAINASFESMGLERGLAQALALDIGIEGRGSPDKAQFMAIARREGVKAALAWRDERFQLATGTTP